MANRGITYGDIKQLLEAEGFQLTGANGAHERFDNAATQAALVIPKKKSAMVAKLLDVELVRRTMLDFGVMTESEFQRWITDPKRFQAA